VRLHQRSDDRVRGLFSSWTAPSRIALLTMALLALGACNVDSFLDPSVAGRWEATPTIVPILDRIAVIEDGTGDEVEQSQVEPHDLIPEIEEYTVGSGDVIEVIIFGLFTRGVPERFTVTVDARGYINLPQVGSVFVSRATRDQAIDAIAQATGRLMDDPIVSITVQGRRQTTFNLIGSVTSPGTYVIPEPDYRLLEALSVGGAFNEDAEDVFVIRQVALTGDAAGFQLPPEAPDPVHQPIDSTTPDAPHSDPDMGTDPGAAGDDLLKVIDDLSQPQVPDGGQPVVMSEPGGAVIRRTRPSAIQPDRPAPVIELVDDEPGRLSRQPIEAEQGAGGASWMFLDGRWVLVRKPTTGSNGSEPGSGMDEPVVTQRVISVPMKKLMAGDARYNLVIRPGDIIRVPRAESGRIFMAGQVDRPGVYTLSPKLTLTRALDAAGGLGPIAIPERVDLVRMVGDDRQAIVRLNLRAIEEGTQPDIYLKDNDRINIGTNFWALPLAVVRGGFRTNYGFGFLLDRNFGNDVFGAPPINRNFGQ